jgi:membrane protein YdbS with pleckstrin-like domain
MFTNDTLDTTNLPRYETVVFTPLHRKYWSVMAVRMLMVFMVLWTALALAVIFSDDFRNHRSIWIAAAALFTVLTVFVMRISFKKRGFAFREHDVLYRYGVISTVTIIIPYNRVQHVALHEGLISRYFKLGEVQIFTAGGGSSDIQIPGIDIQQAENIKQLLMGKIQKQL